MRQQQQHEAADQQDPGSCNNMSRNEEGIRREDSDGSMVMEDNAAERSNPKKSGRNNKKRQLNSSGTTTDDTAAMSHSSDSTFGGNEYTVEHAAMAKREERAPSHSTVATMDTSKSSQLSTSAHRMQQRARTSATKQDSQSRANNTTRSSTTSTINDTTDEGGESAVGEEDQNNRTNKPQQERQQQLSPRRGLKGKQPLALGEKQRMLQAERELQQQQQSSSLSSLPNLPCHSPPAPLGEKQRTFLAEQEHQQQQGSSSLSSLPMTLPSDTTSAAELEKIMEAQSFLDSFGTRHSFTKNAQPNLTSERRRRKRNSSYARRTQSLGENMLPRKSVLQGVLQEAQKEAERERDRAIREILGECSSSSEEEEEEKREEEYETQQQQEPPNSYSAYNSYAARVARKQRDMAVASTSSNSTPGSFAYNSEPSSKQTDVDEEIAKARQQQTSQGNPKSSAAAPLSRSLTPPPTAPLSRHQSSKHSVGTDASAVSSLDDNSLYSNAAMTLPSTSGLSSASTTLTPFQQRMQQQLSNPRSLSSSTTTAQPGAFPTQGRAPFSNPYLRGGGPGDLLRDESEFGADPSQMGNSSRYQTNNHRRRRDAADDGHVSDLGEAAAEETEEEIVAVCVEEDDLENNIRDEIIRSAAQADVVNLDEELSSKDQMVQQLKFLTYCLLAVVLAAVALVIVARMFVKSEDDDDALADDLALNVSEVPSMSPTFNPIPTLQKVSEQGLLRCGIYETTGFDKESGERFGVDADWCRAIAAAVHGKDSYAVKLVNVTFADRFELIANRDIDVLAASSTFTMARNVYEVGVETGLTFSPPFMYDGMRFAGVPEFVECADNDMKNFFECRDIMVCVVGGTSYQVILASRLPKRQIVLVDGWQTLYGGLRDGQCNVIAAEGISLGERNVRAFGYRGNYTVGKSLFSKIPLSIVTRNDDPQWSDFVAAVMQSTFVAEQAGITRENSHMVRNVFMSGSMLFGEAYEDMFENVIATIGNFAEVYERHAESAVPRKGSLTLVNNGTSGLLFSHPFGFINNEGPGPTPGGTLERIMERGKIRCAIKPGRPGFAESIAGQGRSENVTYTGFDIDFCRALATSIFSGSVDLVEFMEVASEERGFEALADDKVDVLAGGSWTLQNDVRQPTTGQGFSFSQPYFYGADFVADIVGSKRGLEDNLCMVTREDDPQWSTYVYWLVASTFYAEERGISQRQSNRMPEVHIFGPSFLRMLRDPILEFGNVGELYERNLQGLIPRGVRNMINSIRNPGPQIYPMPGMLT